MKRPLQILCVALAAAANFAHADADAKRGAELYQARCSACHSIAVNRVGPAHQGTFGRRAGSAPDYDYSTAVKRSKLIWTATNLDRWLANPERLIPGQKMGYAVAEAQDRADLIAHLQAHSSVR